MKKNILTFTLLILAVCIEFVLIDKSNQAIKSFVESGKIIKEADLNADKAELAKETAVREIFKSLPAETQKRYEILSEKMSVARGELIYQQDREVRIFWHLLKCAGACIAFMAILLSWMNFDKKKLKY